MDIRNHGITQYPGEPGSGPLGSTLPKEDPLWRGAKLGALIEYLTNVALGILPQANLTAAEAKKFFGELIDFFEKLGFGDGTINAGVWTPQGMTITQAIDKMMENLLNSIPNPGLEFNPLNNCSSIPCLVPPTVEQVKQFMRIVEIALGTIDRGWKLVNLGFPIPDVTGKDTNDKVRVSVIVTKDNIAGIKGTVTSFIKDYSVKDTSIGRILDDVDAITKFMKDNSANGQFFPANGTNVAVVVINFPMSDSAFQALINQLASVSNGQPVIVVRGGKAQCVANCTGIDATKLAIDLGLIAPLVTGETIPVPSDAVLELIASKVPDPNDNLFGR